jgi:hypothetical protein
MKSSHRWSFEIPPFFFERDLARDASMLGPSAG